MSIHRSYFSRNNTIISNSFTNTGKSPYTQLYFGSASDVIASPGFSRFIFDLDLSLLVQKIQDGIISTGCTGFSGITHTLKMTNTSSFDKDGLSNEYTSQGRLRATSFDLVLFRIPLTSGNTGTAQTWDEGVGYDYYDVQRTLNSTNGLLSPIALPQEFDMTNEINRILTGTTTGSTGWGVAFLPELENLTGLTENYSVGFFTRHTQTFYEPFLETNYNDLILDNRNAFYSYNNNKLYLYSYIGGVPTNLDNLPIVTLENNQGNTIGTYTGCQITQGVYEITTNSVSATTPCMFTDTWSNLYYNGIQIPNVVNDLTVLPYTGYFTLGPNSQDPELFGFDFYGIKQDEKILNTDLRKVGVVVKKAYTSNQVLTPVTVYYRVYVKEGQTEVQVQDWTQVNRASNEYYFIFDTRDKIPNEYSIDIKVLTSGEVDTYKKTLTFQIVDKK